MEQYMIIDEFPNYKISNFGNLMSGGKLMAVSVNKYGFSQANLYSKTKRMNVLIHRLVAKHFLGNPNEHDSVGHLDKDKLNNHVNNLYWYKNRTNTGKFKAIGKFRTTGPLARGTTSRRGNLFVCKYNLGGKQDRQTFRTEYEALEHLWSQRMLYHTSI